jgi:2-hydroxy-3-keto-5-methylthiopentenyl-1-phosphate phosphatase
VHRLCAPFGVDVITSRVDFERGLLEFPHADPECSCAGCGTCKRTPLLDARARGRTTVLVGDGTSDREAARVADRVFAKGALAGWCRAAGIVHTGFTRLTEVRTALGV